MEELDLLRIAMAFLCGGFLTLSGSLTQIVTNNSLGSPSTLGFDALAALSVICSQFIIVVTGEAFALEHVSLGLFLIAFLGLFLVSKIFSRGPHIRVFSLDIKVLILIGLGFNLFVGAIFSIVQFLFMALNFDFPTGLWFGNFKYFDEHTIYVLLFALLILVVYLTKDARQLRLLSLGEKFALGLGIPVAKVQRRALFVSLGLTGVVISFFGVFSFLGLIVPHMLRSLNFFRSNMKRELFIGPIVGGLALAVMDYLCFQFDFRGAEFPAGMVSSVVGAFLLIVLLVKSQAKNFAKD
ncbi:MAG: hypothetical protein CME64_17765 [Halobacteriovoraceae bacterium]|nr:hypothetical protein [Halobacteriovoraceae bacterium]|tara:strand:+ start:25762 stop:26649 length:888 start_codon:yes stop_codon:yes gene_type:complete